MSWRDLAEGRLSPDNEIRAKKIDFSRRLLANTVAPIFTFAVVRTLFRDISPSNPAEFQFFRNALTSVLFGAAGFCIGHHNDLINLIGQSLPIVAGFISPEIPPSPEALGAASSFYIAGFGAGKFWPEPEDSSK